ncbi:Phenoloxidase-activating factor 2-like 4 [Homarus americanus]|uniref:Phenoloxidase-activating factor 2-like 4 n=1 Tax=Homarus americanus TaxID=6706 RepID=A0A8J5IYT9_HOMAM|nr:Phenoloxidase-activating factor 2-like 4 [Homarus americanus]
MRSLVVLVTVLAAATAIPRERRQAEPDCFWWEPDCNNPVDPGGNTSPVPNNTVDTLVLCNGGAGSCVPYYLCREGDIVTDGAGLINIRFGNSTTGQSNSDCPQFLDVCCNNPTDEIPPTDNQAQFGEFPWMVAVLREEQVVSDKPVNLYVCGGSLIHPSVVLTAAHCVAAYKANELKIRAGEWDTQRTYELYPHQESKVNSYVVHEGYNSGALFNDYALLFLEQSLELGPNVDTICLPTADLNFQNSQCWATGWGKDKFGKDGTFQNVLKKIQLEVTTHKHCQTALRTTRLGKFFVLDDSFICAGGQPGVDTCKGDGGSPLVCQDPQDPSRYVQAGIVAWGIGCGEEGIPGVYANIPYGSQWILENAVSGLNKQNIPVGSYW